MGCYFPMVSAQALCRFVVVGNIWTDLVETVQMVTESLQAIGQNS